MRGLDILALVSCVLQPGLAAYTLRLQRAFGLKRVGWWIFYTFLALMLLHTSHLVRQSGFPLSAVDLGISVLLLIGMAHTESFWNGRLKLERQAQTLRDEIDRLTLRTEELTNANANLLQQLLTRDQREKDLTASEQQFRVAFQENPQPMWIFDLRSLRFLAVNDAALRQYGFTSSELANRTARDFHAPEDIPAFLQDCAKPCSAPVLPRLWRHCRKNGVRLHVEVRTLDLLYDKSPARLVVASPQ